MCQRCGKQKIGRYYAEGDRKMHEVKFKVWTGSEILEMDELCLIENNVLKLIGIGTSELICSRLPNQTVLLQFTGLSDKFGNDIYDSFLVTNKTKSFSGDGFSGKNLIFQVKWDENECFYKLELKSNLMFGFKKLTKRIANDLEVIGNIYENSNLITA